MNSLAVETERALQRRLAAELAARNTTDESRLHRLEQIIFRNIDPLACHDADFDIVCEIAGRWANDPPQSD